jgi:hypothetical protein
MITDNEILEFCKLYNKKFHSDTKLNILAFCDENEDIHIGYFLGHIFSDTPASKMFYKEIVDDMITILKELNINYKIALDGKLIGVIINENAFYDFLTYLKILN